MIDAGSVSSQNTSGSAWANTMISMFGRVMYSYADRYMLSASVRRDGSSKFADGNRWGTFPSVSLGWNVMNEDFFENIKETMNELKIRASYGVLGNLSGIGNYATQSVVLLPRIRKLSFRGSFLFHAHFLRGKGLKTPYFIPGRNCL